MTTGPKNVSEATVILTTLVAYKVMMILIGLWAASRNKSEADFFLGGRGLGPFVAGLSYAASTSSAWVILGFSGFVYAVGLSALWMIPGILGAYAVVWLYFGQRVREESVEHQQVTLTDFLVQDGHGDWKRAATVAAGALVFFCFVFYVAAQLDAAGTALTEHFAVNTTSAIIIGAVIVVFYSLVGGFWAVSVTDTVQAAIMMVVSVGVPIAALVAAGGPVEVWTALSVSMPADYLSFGGGHAGFVLVGFTAGLVGMSLGALGQPHLLARLMAVKGEAERRQAFGIVFGWGLVVFTGMVALGLSGRVLVPDIGNVEALFYRAASDFLPLVLAGIATAATLSAVMSTVDSLLLAAAFGPIVLFRVMGHVVAAGPALAAMLSGFAVTVLFFSLGSAPPADSMLSQAAHMPGDPFERVVPWFLPVLILWFSTLRRGQGEAAAS